MRTLGKRITRNFFVDQENGFAQVRKRWSEMVNSKEKLTATDHLLYLAILGKDFRKGFAEVTNGIKRTNGQSIDQGIRLCIRQIHFAILYSAMERRLNRLFPELLNTEEVVKMLKALPTSRESNLLTAEPFDDKLREEETIAA